MLSYERREQILQMLLEKSPIHVNELMNRLGVTAVTIRRDLIYLENAGKLVRTRGMAHLNPIDRNIIAPPQAIPAQAVNQAAKSAIAKAALQMIPEGSTVILDAGSTVLELAKRLADRQDLKIITHSVEIANQLAIDNVPAIVIGGNLFGASRSCVGPEVEEFYRDLSVSIAFVGTSGFRNGKFTIFTSFETSVKRQIIKAAKKVVMLADESKFQCAGLLPFAGLDDIDCLITSGPVADKAVADALLEHQVELIVAEL